MANRYYYAAIHRDRGFSNQPRASRGLTYAEARLISRAAEPLASVVLWLFMAAAVLAFGGLLLSFIAVTSAMSTDEKPYSAAVRHKLRTMKGDEPLLFWSIIPGPVVTALFALAAEAGLIAAAAGGWVLLAIVFLSVFSAEPVTGDESGESQ